MDYKTFKKLTNSYTAIPVYRRLLADILTPVSLFLNIREGATKPFLLESVEGGEQIARYSFLGRNPYQTLKHENNKTVLTKNGKTEIISNSYFDTLEKLTTKYIEPNLQDLPRLTGGAVGYSSYDTYRLVENLPNQPDDDLNLPDAIWAFYDEIYAFDHVKHQIVLVKTVFTDNITDTKSAYNEAQNALDQMEKAALANNFKTRQFSIKSSTLTSNLSQTDFEKMVLQAKKHILNGEISQVVLSQRFEVNMQGDTFMLYRALRMVNPSPYLFYLEYANFSVVGSSPEILVQVQNNKVRLLPIAGTKQRGKTLEHDAQLENELLNDPKENIEHDMLVELGISELKKVCDKDSISIKMSKKIERYSHVMHIVSDLEGDLAKNNTSVDALMQCFPAGTVSGAPKNKAMEVIDQLEQNKRGIYAGAVGYFDFSGNMDTCIAIRTMIATNKKVYIQAGAGIVSDSIPYNEYLETKNKAGALIQALSIALEIK